MRWRMIGMTLIAVGAMMLMTLMNVLPAQGAAPIVPLAPSPRPPVRPTSKPEHNDTNGPGSEIGRITGTIIESSTGAPAPAIKVNVGGEIVASDANGNYERYVPVGVYTVTLALDAGQGQADQPTQAVQVIADQTTIQHLYYTRAGAVPAPVQQPAPPAPTATAAPQPSATAAPQPSATAAPAPATAVPAPATAMPAPATAMPQPVAPTVSQPSNNAGGVIPVRLPVTGEAPSANLGVWLIAGLVLIALGGILVLRPGRR